MYNISPEFIQQHRDELIRAAEQERLVESLRAEEAGRSPVNVVIAEIGRQMVTIGQRLQEMNDAPNRNFSES
ncbi:MAG: hypothetical protein H7Y09_01950 [Chitinophagaceae bacterium]|nr:hypothetical protein [Anaerolineae bacterium]